jgi:hypothetical protein
MPGQRICGEGSSGPSCAASKSLAMPRAIENEVSINHSTRILWVTHLGQTATDSTGLLSPEVEGEVFLALVVLKEVLASLLVHDGQYPGNRLADGVATIP